MQDAVNLIPPIECFQLFYRHTLCTPGDGCAYYHRMVALQSGAVMTAGPAERRSVASHTYTRHGVAQRLGPLTTVPRVVFVFSGHLVDGWMAMRPSCCDREDKTWQGAVRTTIDPSDGQTRDDSRDVDRSLAVHYYAIDLQYQSKSKEGLPRSGRQIIGCLTTVSGLHVMRQGSRSTVGPRYLVPHMNSLM